MLGECSFCVWPLVVFFPHPLYCGSHSGWLRPEGNAFAQYATLLRLMSGMSEVGVARALVKAAERKRDQEHERSLRTDPTALLRLCAFLNRSQKWIEVLSWRSSPRTCFLMVPLDGLATIVPTQELRLLSRCYRFSATLTWC